MAASSSGVMGSAAAAASKLATSASASASAFTFTPRRVFDVSPSITRSYFLGHHHAAVNRMRQVLTNIGLVIECRDIRVPLTSWNPILENELAAVPGRARIIVYTKRDLIVGVGRARRGQRVDGEPPVLMSRLQNFHAGEQMAKRLGTSHQDRIPRHEDVEPPATLFLGENDGGRSDMELLKAIKGVARRHDSLVGLRALVVGMPNAGKSTLLNRLRKRGMGKDKAAKTGVEPGVTRKLGTPVRILDGDGDGGSASGIPGEGVFIMDTPGVFIPYVASAEAMLKLALVGCVKDGLVPPVVIADYLLYHLNLRDPSIYTSKFGCQAPTNSVDEFLEAVARRTGKLVKGGVPNIEAAAIWAIQQWRTGELGRFALDTISHQSLQQARYDIQNPVISMNEARQRDKERRKAVSAAKRKGG